MNNAQPTLLSWSQRYDHLREVTREDVLFALDDSTGTRRIQLLISLRSLFAFCKKTGKIFRNPTRGIKVGQQPYRLAQPLDQDDVNQAVQAATTPVAREEYLEQIDAFGDTGGWVEGLAESKISAFAAEADAADAAVLKDYDPVKRVALLACLAHTARARARDDLAEMLCKRIAVIVKKAKAQPEDIRGRQRVMTEQLVGNYRAVLERLAPGGAAEVTERAAAAMACQALKTFTGAAPDPQEGGADGAQGEDHLPMRWLVSNPGEALVVLLKALKLQADGIGAVRGPVENAGGFARQLADIEEVSAYYGDNHEMLVQRSFRKDRATMFKVADILTFEVTSQDRRVLDAFAHAVAHWNLTRDFIPGHVIAVDEQTGEEVRLELDVSFASGNWQKVIRDRKYPGMLVRQQFEACVFAYLAEELRTGDIAVRGAACYANWAAQMLPWSECEPLLDGFCEQAGLPATAAEFVANLMERHKRAAADLDAGYSENADLVIDENGVPTLKRRRGSGTSASAAALGEAIKQRMRERSLLSIVARTAYWLEWWRHFGPASGSDPKLADPQGRYVITQCREVKGHGAGVKAVVGVIV
jgi:hypothetical protein